MKADMLKLITRWKENGILGTQMVLALDQLETACNI